MANEKVTDLPSVVSAALTDIIYAVQGGISSQETLAQVQAAFGFTTGILDLAHGGTNANLTADNGAIAYSDGTKLQLLAHTTTAGKVLQSGNSTAPSWSTPTYPSISGTVSKILISDGTNNVYSTATYPSTTTINQLLYSSANNVVGGLTAANSSILASSSTGVPTWVGPLTNGQVLIGSTGATPVAATLSAGPGVSISTGAGSITISGTGSGIGWTEVTGTSQTMIADNGYVANNAGLVTFTLPATAAFGTAINVIGKGAGGWQINTNGGQNIRVGSSNATTSIASTNQFDSIELICTTANTTWTDLSGPQGIITIV